MADPVPFFTREQLDRTARQLMLENGPGVKFTEPPPDRLRPIAEAIQSAVNTLPPEAKGAIVGIANEQGANAALVVRAGERIQILSWIGKEWGGSTNYGAAVRAQW